MKLEFYTIHLLLQEFFFSAPDLQFSFGNLIVEGSQGADCKVTHWGDEFLIQVSFSLGPHFFFLRIPCFFPGVSALISQLSASHLCALLLQDLPCEKPWSTGWDFTSQTLHFPPDSRFTNIPQITPKKNPSLHQAGTFPSSVP